jgi:hypothetical protein
MKVFAIIDSLVEEKSKVVELTRFRGTLHSFGEEVHGGKGKTPYPGGGEQLRQIGRHFSAVLATTNTHHHLVRFCTHCVESLQRDHWTPDVLLARKKEAAIDVRL